MTENDLKTPPDAVRLKGVFSTETSSTVGFGDTRKKSVQKMVVYAEEDENGVKVRLLNANFVPTGEARTMNRDEFLSAYLPEPQLYIQKVRPQMRKLEDSVARGDALREGGRHYSAEFEYKNALRLDEEHVRSMFGLGMVYLDRGDQGAANIVFKRLVKVQGTFVPEHKHLFNDFGIMLRKNRMFDQALTYYARAFRMARDDEHLLYNMARVLYEKGKAKGAVRLFRRALALNPSFRECAEFLAYLEKTMDRADALPKKPKGRLGPIKL